MAITAISRDWGIEPSIVRITTTDDLTTITTTGYLTTQKANIELLQNGDFEWVVGDYILIYYSDGEGFFTHDVANDTFDAAPAAPGTLSDTLQSGHVLVGNVSNVATDTVMSGAVTIDNAGVTTISSGVITSANLDNRLIKYATVAMTAAQFKGMYAAPLLVLAPIGADRLIVVHRGVLAMTYGTTAYTAGGVVAFQYDNTVHGGGDLASNTEAAADFFATASTSFMFTGNFAASIGMVDFAGSVNKGIYLSNPTAAFATGDSNFVVHLWYSIIATA